MKRFSVIAVIVVMTVALSIGLSWGYEVQKASRGLIVTLLARSYPLVMGDNSLSLRVTDSSGKAVTDAKITVRFFMPPMPGMAPMSSTVQAPPKGDVYPFTANVAMAGTWKAEVTIVWQDKAPVTATFNLDAR